jgi:protein TonB
VATSVVAHAAALGLAFVLGTQAGGDGAGRPAITVGAAALPLSVLAAEPLVPPDAAPEEEAPAIAASAEEFPLPLPEQVAAAPAAPRWLRRPQERRARPAAPAPDTASGTQAIALAAAAQERAAAAPPLEAETLPAAPPALRSPPSVDPAGCPAPAYPRRALRRGWQGTVWLLLEVDADGRPTTVTLDRTSGHADLDEAALAAARAWRLTPALEGATPVAGALRVPVTFRLDEVR